jgi:TolB-like protein/DNA-binding winged helix-turn-helix (wHTH) protein/Tfp pilus assembly protein PilF
VVPSVIRFGVFEVDVAARQLRKSGIKVKLEQQPLEVLLLLLGRPGEVVTREELRGRLWPDGVHVDFDRSLNKAVVKLREALGDVAESPRFIETRPRHGYRFIAPVELRVQVEENVASPASKKPRTLVWGACAAAILWAGATLIWRTIQVRHTSHVSSIAVLPLRNLSGDPNQEYLASGMTEVLTTGLAQLGALDVIASSSTQRYQKMDKPPAQIARELNVDALVDGSVQRSGNRVLVTARLIDGTTARQLWARSYERDYRDALSLQAEIANVIAEEIGAKLTARTRRPTSANPEAQDAFLRGEFLYRRGDFKRSFALYQQAIEKDPHFAAAYTRLPFYYLLGDGSLPMEEGLAQWKAAVKRALELDPNLDEAHRAYGVLLGGSEWNWKDAEREYKIALGLNPNLALAHQQYGGMLAYTGRADEAIQELKRAQRLDPASGSVGTMLALAYWFARRPDELFAQAQRFEDLDARWPPLFRAYAHELKGEFDQAIRDLMLMPKEDGAPIVERYIVERAHAYTVLGKTKEARDSLIELLQLSQKRKVGAWFFACLYAALGEKDRAFEWLDKAYMERPSEMVSFAASPDMDPLRSDPRYEAMLRRMGIPER